jgi:cytochrome P450
MTKRLEGKVNEAVTSILDNVPHRSEVDFVEAIAAQVPLHLIADLIGWPDEDRKLMFDWTNRVTNVDMDLDDARNAAAEFWGYCATLIERVKKEADGPQDDLLHILLAAEVDGKKLEMVEIVNFLLLLAIGGNETTRNCIAGGFLALHDNPEQLAALRADPEGLLDTAVEEMLRWTAPITCFRRTATEDTEIRGQRIREGEKVVVYYASANRDEDVFDDPQKFDIRRQKNPHLSFGTGQHSCMGATLARMEIRTAFRQLLTRFPDMEPRGPVKRLASNYMNSTVGFSVITGP